MSSVPSTADSPNSPMRWKLGLQLAIVAILSVCHSAASQCTRGCDLALASYYVWENSNLTFILRVMQSSILQSTDFDKILSYNPQVANKDSVSQGIRINVPFPCGCINGEFLAHVFNYSVTRGDTYGIVANRYYANLTTVQWLQQFNSYDANRIPDTAVLNVTVNCSCGDSAINKSYGLFTTYPLRPGETVESVARTNNVTVDLLRSYNVGVNFSRGSGLVYIPSKGNSFLVFHFDL
uniref:Uncharacterized protein MANES_13G068500 n=1 Tax=Rhizophora mucronata TaxID=61149 RepID=A0A2P2MP75_RHIMU